MTFLALLSQWWCGLRHGGHYNIASYTKDNWHLRCMNCGHLSAGWLIEQGKAPLALSSQDIEDITKEMIQLELHHHGGG